MSPAVITSTANVGVSSPAVPPVGMPTQSAVPASFAGRPSGQPAPLRLQVFSDLHLDVNRSAPPRLAPGAELVVVAGDTCEGCIAAFAALRVALRGIPIVYVAGNHESYGRSLPDELSKARRVAAEHGVAFLEDDVVVVAGVRFVGATMWSDYCLEGASRQAASMNAARRLMPDHRHVLMSRRPRRLFQPEDALAMHVASRRFIEEALSTPFSGPTVVVTHHGPHPRSVAARYQGDELNAAFVSDLSGTIDAGRPVLWVHGHVHSSFDYRVGATRVVCNPHGYGSENLAFDPAMVVKVPR